MIDIDVTSIVYRRAGAVIDGSSAASRGDTDAPISSRINGAILALPCLKKLFCAT